MALLDKFFGTAFAVFMIAYMVGRTKTLGPLLAAPVPNPDTELENLSFVKLKGDVWVNTPLTFTPFKGADIPLTLWLVKDKSGWILVDAGIPETNRPGFAAAYIAAINKVIAAEKGELKLLLLTHGHIDHVGAIPTLLKEFPSLTVGMHAAEKPYMAEGGGASYSKIRGAGLPNVLFNFFLGGDTGILVPQERAAYLEGPAGDVASLKGDGGQAVWAPTSGVLKFIHAPGHAPGHLVFVHTPSKVLIAGDAIGFASPLGGGPDVVNIAPPLFSYNTTLAAESVAGPMLASKEWDFCSPAHDSAGKGLTRAAVEAFAAGTKDYIWKSK